MNTDIIILHLTYAKLSVEKLKSQEGENAKRKDWLAT